MSYNFRLPNITSQDPQTELVQLKSYMYQLVKQLNFAMADIEKKESGAVKTNSKTASAGKTDQAEAQNNFNAIKALIIKSADIVNAYYEEINERLEGIYVSQSEFGVYTETTEQNITKNSTGIEQLFSSLQGIISSVEEIQSTLLAVDAYIKSGLLGYDAEGLPIYGLEIGQRNTVDGEEIFNKFARFTADRLSFYDQNDIEVAYISDYRLYITEARISGNLSLGQFVFDTSDGIVIRWAGD